MIKVEYNLNECIIELSKHFRNTWMRKWNWNIEELKDAINNAYKVDKVGKNKFEAFTRKDGSKKIIFVYYPEDAIFVITGAEGT